MARKPTLQAIALATTATINMAPQSLKERSRLRRITRPRHIAMFLAREINGSSLERIGQFFDRDHTTVLSALEKLRYLMDKKPSVVANVERVKATLRLRGYDI